MHKYFFLWIFLFGFFTSMLAQDAMEEIRERKEEALKEIEYANQLLEETRDKREVSLNDLAVVSHLLESRRRNLRVMESEAEQIAIAIAENEAEIGNIESHIASIKAGYAQMLSSAYKQRRKNYLIIYFLSSDNMYQAYKRIRYYKLYNDYLRGQSEELTEFISELEHKNIELNALNQDKESLILATTLENSKIRAQAEEKNSIVAELEKREQRLINEIREKESVARQLENELTALIEAERNRSGESDLAGGLSTEDRLISDEFGQNKGRLPWPTEQGIVTGKYGEHAHPDYQSVVVRNDGIYISTLPGTMVHAIFKGEISRVFSIPGENYTVIIRHGEYFTLYHNLVHVQVTQGQIVNTGQLIGNVYTDDDTRESLLYFQVWHDIERNNPEEWLSN